jgi:hypothetical protein
MHSMLRRVAQLFCGHKETATKTEAIVTNTGEVVGGRMYEECIGCLWTSGGIATGGHEYVS